MLTGTQHILFRGVKIAPATPIVPDTTNKTARQWATVDVRKGPIVGVGTIKPAAGKKTTESGITTMSKTASVSIFIGSQGRRPTVFQTMVANAKIMTKRLNLLTQMQTIAKMAATLGMQQNTSIRRGKRPSVVNLSPPFQVHRAGHPCRAMVILHK